MKLSQIHITKNAASLLGMFFALVMSANLSAQDVHFSQFYQAPARLNPALTGRFHGGYRLTGIFRSQWASVTVPYQTINISGDARDFLNVGGLGAGIDLFYDKAGDANLGTFNINISGAYTFGMVENGMHHLTVGGQFGYARKQLDPSKLVFDNNGGGTIESFEPGFSYFNANAGMV